MPKRHVLPLTLVLTAACSARPQPPEPTQASAPPVEQQSREEFPEPDSGYSYSPVGRTDPFRDKLAELAPPAPTTDLERWDIDQLKLVALILSGARPVALFEDPNGLGHSVFRGTRIGRNGGKVAGIFRDRVLIREERRTFSQTVVEEIELKLRSDLDPSGAST